MSEHSVQAATQVSALQGVLRELDLTGAAQSIASRIDEAREDRWSPEQFLARLLADEVAHRAERAPPQQLSVSGDGRWFQVDAHPPVSLHRRTALRRLLVAVLDKRAEGGAVRVPDMVKAGWPRDTLTPQQGATRVYTAIRSLRRMGLENILLTTDRGYELAPEVEVVRQPG